MLDPKFNDALPIIQTLEERGFKAYFVGGCVRDLLLERPISDIDIATSARPEEVQNVFSNVIPVGIEHGTVIVRHKQKSYEVTTFRVDGKYSDQRHPDDVAFIKTIDEDLKRRDFTINALAMNAAGNVIDLFNGMNDLNKKIIRTVGKGSDRFQEDPLRIIRALRFSSQLGFKIEANTLRDMKEIGFEITELSVERIHVEIAKFFGGSYINLGIDYLKSTEIYKYLPVMINYPYIINKLPKTLLPLDGFAEVIVLFHYLEPSISTVKWYTSWKCSNQEKKAVVRLINSIDHFLEHGLNQWFAYQLGTDYVDGFVRIMNVLYPNCEVSQADILEEMDALVIRSSKELEINGHDLQEIFPDKKTGPWMKKILNEVEKQVVLNNIPNKNRELKDWIKWNPQGIN